MNVFHGLENITTPRAPSAVAIGVFDGVHRGHQEILRQTVREARSEGFAPVALTFDIHPSELFAPAQSPPYICSLSQRAALMDAHGGGLETVVIVRFDWAFAALSPSVFVADILRAKLNARHILVGADFCYGKGRAGTVTTLLTAGAQNGFTVTVVPPILMDDERVSSTGIRQFVADGKLEAATSWLGHPFIVEGVVVTGKKLGRTLGFPTANLLPTQTNQLLPGNGVYAARAVLEDGRTARAAVSIGTNPTTDTDGARKVEAFLLDGFAEDIYGQTLALEMVAKVRDEVKFDSLDALTAQMARDVKETEKEVERRVF